MLSSRGVPDGMGIGIGIGPGDLLLPPTEPIEIPFDPAPR